MWQPQHTDVVHKTPPSRCAPKPSEASLVAQVHYKPRRHGNKNPGAKRARSPPDARASRILQHPCTGGVVCVLLRILPALSPPTHMWVHAHLSRTPAPQTPLSPVPPTHETPPPHEVFAVRSVFHLNALLRDTRRALMHCHRAYALIVSLSRKATAWVHAILAAWKSHMLSVRYNFRASCVRGALYAKVTMVHVLLAHHSFTLAHVPKLSLFSSLLGVYQRQVHTIRGATVHHMSLSHQRYTTWASMMVYRKRAHEQWLNKSMEEAGMLYNTAFQSTSRAIRHSHAMLVCSRLNQAYASVAAQKCHIFS